MTRVSYQEYPNHIHQFTFFEDGHEAIDEWASGVEEIQLKGQWYGQDVVRMVLDTRNILQLPIRYLFECLSDYNREYPQLKPPRLRIAYIHHENSLVLSIFRTFASLMSTPVEFEFFNVKDANQALNWVKSDNVMQV